MDVTRLLCTTLARWYDGNPTSYYEKLTKKTRKYLLDPTLKTKVDCNSFACLEDKHFIVWDELTKISNQFIFLSQIVSLWNVN